MVVFTTQPSLSSILSNNIHFGQTWTMAQNDPNSPEGYKCKCQELSDKFTIPLDDDGHIRINGIDLPTESPSLHGLLCGNIKNKSRPSLDHFTHSWKEQIKAVHYQIRKIASNTGSRDGQPYGPSKKTLKMS